MKSLIKLITVLSLALATFSQHFTASALDMFKFRGLGANASFSTVDGCIQTNVDVFTLLRRHSFKFFLATWTHFPASTFLSPSMTYVRTFSSWLLKE
jgi:hypothetical protein